MKRKITMFSLIALFMLSMSVTPTYVSAAPPAELTLGGLFPLSGGLAAGGVEREAASRIAVENINADDTILPDTVLKIEKRDTATDPTTGAAAATELINAGVFGLVGAASSGVSMAIAAKAEAAKVPQISYSSTNADLSDKTEYPYFLRVVPPDSVQGVALANIVNEFGWDTVATLSTSDDYGQGGIDVFKTAAADNGITIATAQEFAQGASDVKTQLQTIIDSGAKIIVLNMIVADAVTVFSQAAAVGITPEDGFAWVGSDGPTQTVVFENSTDAKAAMQGMIGTAPNRGSGALFEAFLDDWEAADPNVYAGAGDREPNTYATFAYDAVYAFARAAHNMILAGEDPTDGALLLKELAALEFTGATGPISFDSNYDRLGVYDILNLKDDKFEIVGTWDLVNGMKLTGTIVWPDGTTNIPTDSLGESILPGFEIWMTMFAVAMMVPIIRKRKY